MLDALRREPDTGFAIHDAPSRVEQLLDRQSELRSLLRQRPPDVRPAIHQAELALQYAQKELSDARYRLQHAQERLERFGPLSQLRHHGRRDKSSVLDAIDRFTGQVNSAESKVVRCRDELEELRAGRHRRSDWDAEHGWPDERLRTVDVELHALTQPARDLAPDRPTHLSQRTLDPAHQWLDRVAEVARPPLPGPDLGIDIGP